MNYHIALSRPFDLKRMAQDAKAGKCPRHVMWDLSQRLEATVHQPTADLVRPLDRVRAKLISSPEHWALARRLSSRLQEDDLVFCTGEDVCYPLLSLCGAKRSRPKIVATIHAPERPRARGALKLFGLAKRVDLFMTNTDTKAEFLRRYLHLSNGCVHVLSEQTDTTFFSPGPASVDRLRPLIASGGLEQRDYDTLARATQNLAVNVKVCAVSPNASASTRVAFPKIVPANMSFHSYDWLELVQLYRDADIVVISLLDNNYSAGLTTLLEAMACRRPVVITRTSGLAQQLIDLGVVTGVNPNSSDSLQQAIVNLLSDPQKAEVQAQRGYELVLKQHSSERYIETLINQLTSKRYIKDLVPQDASPSAEDVIAENWTLSD